MKKYGKTIARLRKEKGLTQEQLGKMLNVSYQAISKWENDLAEPSLETIEKLAEIFDISLAEFFNLSNGERIEGNGAIKDNAKSVNSTKLKPWYLVLGLSVFTIILALCAFLIPVKYTSNQIFEAYNSAFFFIKTKGDNGTGKGTGFFINKSGLAVTVYSNIANCTSLTAEVNGKEYDIEKIVGADIDKNIAIIQIDIEKSDSIKIGDSNDVKMGDKVYAITFTEIDKPKISIAEGMVFKVESDSKGVLSIQTTASFEETNSGGALFNENGKVIGIILEQLDINGIGFDMVNVCQPINEVGKIDRDINEPLDMFNDMIKKFSFYSDNKVVEQKEFISGDTITKIKDPIKKGYILDGWYADSEYESEFDFSKPIYENGECYAKWTPIKYTIKFDANGGVGSMEDIELSYDESYTLPNNEFYKPQYNFVGWKVEGEDKEYNNNQIVRNLTDINNDIVTLVAKWEIIEYTIHFDGNGSNSGEMNDIVLKYDQVINLPTNSLIRKGYNFVGWLYNDKFYKDSAEVSKLSESEGTVVLLAQWEPIDYIVRFVYEGQETYEQEFIYDDRQKLLKNRFTKVDYNFSNWYSDALKRIFLDEEEVANLTDIDGGIVELHAVFAEMRYNVRYNPHNEIDLDESVIESYSYSEIVQVQDKFNLRGYIFRYYVDENGTIYSDTFTKLSNIDNDIIDLFAVWDEITYTPVYRYIHKDEFITDLISTKSYEEEFVLEEPRYSFDGYEFVYYKVYSNIYDAGETVSRLTYVNNSYVAIDAVYEPKEYEIVFDGNGATSGEMNSILATFDSPVTIPTNTYVREGYTFMGWQFNDLIYNSTDIGIPITKYQDSITLTAQWIQNLNGEGTNVNPYTISTLDDLNRFASLTKVNQFKDKYVVLSNDIDCEFNKVKPIIFSGIFDGKGHKIVNIDYESGALFEENKGIIQNLNIDNLQIEYINSEEEIYIAGLVKINAGIISKCSVNGRINIENSNSPDIKIYGFVANNQMFNPDLSNRIEYCFSNLEVTINSNNDIENLVICGFADGDNITADYNYSTLKFTANLGNVDSLNVNAFGFENTHSFAKANIDINAEAVNSYNLRQTVKYYSSDSEIKLLIGGKSVPNLIETTTQTENLKDREWMENNLFDVSGVWIYDSINFPTLNYSYQKEINSQEEFIALNGKVIYDDYILNCDIDLSSVKNFRIQANYGTFNGNGHIIKNYILKTDDYFNSYSLFSANFGTIKNLGIENIDIQFNHSNMKKNDACASGLVAENYGTIYACFAKGKIEASTLDYNLYIGGLVAVSYGEVTNCYTDVVIDATMFSEETTQTELSIGGLIAYGNGMTKNCFSIGDVNLYSHYAYVDILSAYGLSGSEGKVLDSFVLSNVSISVYDSYSYDYYIHGIGRTYENCYAYEWQTVTYLSDDMAIGDKSYDELCSLEFLSSLNFEAWVDLDYLQTNPNAVWTISESALPTLWYEA